MVRDSLLTDLVGALWVALDKSGVFEEAGMVGLQEKKISLVFSYDNLMFLVIFTNFILEPAGMLI